MGDRILIMNRLLSSMISVFIILTHSIPSWAIYNLAPFYAKRALSGTGSSVSPWLPASGNPPVSCKHYHMQGADSDGYYRIWVNSVATVVYCDMTRNGGGWTLVATPITTYDIFSEPYTTVFGPASGQGYRVTNIWSDSNNYFLFSDFRLTDETSGDWAIANLGTEKTLYIIAQEHPTYSQNVTTMNVSSTIGAACFIVRGKSGAVTPFTDTNADYMFIGFHSRCGTATLGVLDDGDTWDRTAYSTQWVVGGTDYSYDPIQAPHTIGRRSSGSDWPPAYSATTSPTYVWLR